MMGDGTLALRQPVEAIILAALKDKEEREIDGQGER